MGDCILRHTLILFVFLSAAFGSLNRVHADTIAYTNNGDFMAALVGTPQTLGFDSQTAGELVYSGDQLGGIAFTYDFGGVSMQVASGSSTTSGSNYLGTDDFDIFQAGDEFTMSFGPSSAIGLYIISADGMFDGDVVLKAMLANNTWLNVSAQLDADVFTDLGDGSYAYFLGLITDIGSITSARLTMPDEVEGAFLYNLDDITTASIAAVPAPSSWCALIGMGVMGFIVCACRRQNES